METEQYKITVCRVCLKCDLGNDGNGANIFNKSDDVFIYEKLNTIANVQIKPEDGLPDRICVECLQELDNAIHFKHKCETSNNVLLSAVNTKSETSTKEAAAVDDVKLEEEQYSDHEYLDKDEDAHTPPDIHIKHELDDHLQSEEEDKPPNTQKPSRAIDLKLECHDCGGFFRTKCKLRVHWKKEHLRQYLTCDKCKRVFSSFKSLNTHKTSTLFKNCVTLSNMFNIEGTGVHRKFYCKQCQYSTTRKITALTHTVTHTGDKKYKCELCKKTFTQQSGLSDHKESVHQLYQKEDKCNICGKFIQGKIKFNNHMRKHKNENNTFNCEICHKVYKAKQCLRVHMQTHFEKTYTCPVCSKKFATSASLSNHKSGVHDKNTFHICPICGYKSNKTFTIKTHIARHNGDSCACIVCGKFFENDAQLSLHKQRHNNRNHKCTQCDKTYFSRKGLNKHVHKVH